MNCLWKSFPRDNDVKTFAAGKFQPEVPDSVKFQDFYYQFGKYLAVIQILRINIEEKIPSLPQLAHLLLIHACGNFKGICPEFFRAVKTRRPFFCKFEDIARILERVWPRTERFHHVARSYLPVGGKGKNRFLYVFPGIIELRDFSYPFLFKVQRFLLCLHFFSHFFPNERTFI